MIKNIINILFLVIMLLQDGEIANAKTEKNIENER